MHRIIREIKLDKKEASTNKLKEIKNESDNINHNNNNSNSNNISNIAKLTKKHNSTKILNTNQDKNKDESDFVPNSKFSNLKK